ncbi:GGDEF domain-containing protein [Sphingomicrobium sediminis]|uniref:diguanylate cyclase n=1 Tax=Sphingomicrobium sediminis TaxID=2950949 RepID=A0A9X2EH53_9SPHN|nr:GGDEF domain-containing protein [Sphingomicrobium sediminis]MCM8557422.1 GGDEF domain-containing protein [Sphingomicrobium sediminis]
MSKSESVGRYDGAMERELIRALIDRAQHSVLANIFGLLILIGMAFMVPFREALVVGILLRMTAVCYTGYNTGRIRMAITSGKPVTPEVNRFAWGMAWAGLTWGALLFVIPLQEMTSLSAMLIVSVVVSGVLLVAATASAVPQVMWSYFATFIVMLVAWLFYITPTYGMAPVFAVLGLGAAGISAASSLTRESNGAAKLIFENRQLAEKLTSLNAELEAIAEEKSHLASHDPLTGLANRRSFELFAENITEAGDRSQWSVLLIDLDHFKEVNDAAGHAGGDAVLIAAGSLLKSVANALPDQGFAARIGGEEFVLMVRGLRDSAVRDIAVSVNARLRVVPAPDGYDGTISGSIGTSRWADDEPIDRCLQRADRLLYDAKEQGRNRIVASQNDIPDLPYDPPLAS